MMQMSEWGKKSYIPLLTFFLDKSCLVLEIVQTLYFVRNLYTKVVEQIQ